MPAEIPSGARLVVVFLSLGLIMEKLDFGRLPANRSSFHISAVPEQAGIGVLVSTCSWQFCQEEAFLKQACAGAVVVWRGEGQRYAVRRPSLTALAGACHTALLAAQCQLQPVALATASTTASTGRLVPWQLICAPLTTAAVHAKTKEPSAYEQSEARSLATRPGGNQAATLARRTVGCRPPIIAAVRPCRRCRLCAQTIRPAARRRPGRTPAAP